ncbi:hypothetical protein BDF20DRAFT_817417 [Mycotypha africana]|uniref:uncharacterized protein n=1 Tax=Mycotypha africana TaxID=64632 RepID=UPI0023014F2F|nr:uncharacterized protein BDF20DRAFT_817417 [Mycotypha africana]KAI8982244.1 hypothetical protein BDF20DRAFT_817417 [Mycotypha africana]
MDMDYEGPDADYLIDTTDIYEQTVYENIRVQNDEWEIIDESEAAPYLPDTTTKRKVTIGLQENRKEVPLSRFDSVLLDDYFELRKGHLLNTGGSIWGLDFVPKGPADKDDKTSSIQYLAVAGLRGTTDQEHFGLNTIQPTGTYKNAIQLWRLKLSTKQAPERARLDMCLLHDFGVICDLRWCPYGVFEDENVKRINIKTE